MFALCLTVSCHNNADGQLASETARDMKKLKLKTCGQRIVRQISNLSIRLAVIAKIDIIKTKVCRLRYSIQTNQLLVLLQ